MLKIKNNFKNHAICALLSVLCALTVSACSTVDPILPGERTPVFSTGTPTVENRNLPDELIKTPKEVTPSVYEQNSDNEIFEVLKNGEKRKVFAGMPTMSHIDYKRAPVFDGGFVYAGLSTGEVIRVNSQTREVVWIADVYKDSLITGGTQLLDIAAPVIVDGAYVYAGGLGDAICKLKKSDGSRVWCKWVGTGTAFTLAGGVIFVSGIDNNLYAIDAKSGDIFWRAKIKKQGIPKITQNENGRFIVSVGNEKFWTETGKQI